MTIKSRETEIGHIHFLAAYDKKGVTDVKVTRFERKGNLLLYVKGSLKAKAVFVTGRVASKRSSPLERLIDGDMLIFVVAISYLNYVKEKAYALRLLSLFKIV